jgi:hypothetical protein
MMKLKNCLRKFRSRIHVAAVASLLPASMFVHADDFTWNHRATQGAVTLTANPLDSAARTAFYLARGFSEESIRPYATACGFSFGMHNNGSVVLSTRLPEWYFIGADGRRVAIRLPEAWDADWEQAGVSQAARIAFRWSQFQTEITFQPGDWIMGMATLEESPSAPFRLVARYRDEKGNHELVLDRLSCAQD